MNKILKDMGWKTRYNTWDTREVLLDVLFIAVISIIIAVYISTI